MQRVCAMREIKFRAWDKDSKRMHYAEDLIGPGGWVIRLFKLKRGAVPFMLLISAVG
jgi:hypothetical protein